MLFAPARGLPLPLLGMLVGLACAGSPAPKPHAGLDGAWGEFLQAPRQRAFAVAGDPDGKWAGGIVGGTHSPMDAEREALALCERRRVAKGIDTPCRLYAVGSRIVWTEPVE